jgi:hypothetical protein
VRLDRARVSVRILVRARAGAGGLDVHESNFRYERTCIGVGGCATRGSSKLRYFGIKAGWSTTIRAYPSDPSLSREEAIVSAQRAGHAIKVQCVRNN